MENILPTELKWKRQADHFCVYINDELILALDLEHAEIFELAFKLYNEYMKNGSGSISIEESKPKFGKVWPSK